MTEHVIPNRDSAGSVEPINVDDVISLGDAGLDDARRQLLDTLLRCRESASHTFDEETRVRLRRTLEGIMDDLVLHCRNEEARMLAIAHPLTMPHCAAHRALEEHIYTVAARLADTSALHDLELQLDLAICRLATHFTMTDGLCAGMLGDDYACTCAVA